MTFGQKLRMFRVGKGLTQAEMANKLGISRRAYISYELGQAKPRSKNAYHIMAEILNCGVDDLLEEEPKNAPEDKINWYLKDIVDELSRIRKIMEEIKDERSIIWIR